MKINISDRVIPGTLNVSCTLPALFEAILFTSAVEMDSITLALMIEVVLGSYIGADAILKWMREKFKE